MSINPRRLANGKTVYDVRLRTPDGQAYKRTFPTKRTAEAWQAAERSDRARGTWVDPNAGALTLADYAEQWMAQRPELRPRTVELYESLLRIHIVPALGHIRLRDLTSAMIRSWHADLLRARRPGPATVAKCYRLLRTILTTAVEDDLLVKNPCRLRRAGVEHSPERPVATIAQVDAIVAATPERYQAMVLLATWCGLRLGEAAGLACRHIDLTAGTVTVERQLLELHNGTSQLAQPKTDAGRRTIAIPPHLIPILGVHLEQWSEPGPDGWVFTAPEGGPINRHNFYHRVWRPAALGAGVPHLRFHDLRHTGNTLAASTGASTKELMARMGHASPRAALIYQHSTVERDRAIAEALSALASTGDTDRSRPPKQ